MNSNNLRWLSGSAIAFVLLYATGTNRNLFFLAFGFSCTVVAIVWARTALMRLAAAALFVGSAAVTVSAPLPPRGNAHEGFPDGMRKLPAGVPVTFRFQLHNIEEHRPKCGAMQSYAMITGDNLLALDISANGIAPLSVDIRHTRDVPRPTIWARLPDDIKGAVELKLVPRQEAALYQGPEVDGREVYPDAVYLMFANETCRVLYHVRRATSD